MKVYRNIALCVIFLITHNAISFGQVNYVANPSFEEISSCPDGFYQLNRAIGWSTLKNGGGGNPDLYHTCCTDPFNCGVPLNNFNLSFQYPHSGNVYVGIDVAIYSQPNNFREYIQSKLKKGLSAGHTYCVKFYTSLLDQNLAYITTLGAYLDSGNVHASTYLGLAIATPQVYNNAQPLNDTVNWMKIEGSIATTGLETYITIGNFFNDSASHLGFFGSPTVWASYYYIDDVSVIDSDLSPYAGKDTLIHSGDSLFIGRQPEIGLNEDCIWFVNGLPIDTVAGMWVQPDTTTTYIVQQTICGNVKWDTVTVTVSGVGIEGHFNEVAFKIYPNPATHLLHIESPVTKTMISITNLLGQEVLRQQVSEKQFSMDVSKLEKGVYFLLMKSEKGVFVRKFLKN